MSAQLTIYLQLILQVDTAIRASGLTLHEFFESLNTSPQASQIVLAHGTDNVDVVRRRNRSSQTTGLYGSVLQSKAKQPRPSPSRAHTMHTRIGITAQQCTVSPSSDDACYNCTPLQQPAHTRSALSAFSMHLETSSYRIPQYVCYLQPCRSSLLIMSLSS